jgi:hypothetical protein
MSYFGGKRIIDFKDNVNVCDNVLNTLDKMADYQIV